MSGYNRTRYVEQLLERTETAPPSFTVHLHTEYWVLNNGSKFLYHNQIASLLDDIRSHRIPVDFLELFESARVPFYEGCMIVELLDYRPQKSSEPALKNPERTRVVLHPSPETLWADICSLNQRHGGKWTDEEALKIEAKLLRSISQPLCLDPDPNLTRIVNNVLRASTPSMPLSLKRKASAMEPEEDGHEKAKRERLLGFMAPREKRLHASNYRLLDAIEINKQKKETEKVAGATQHGNQYIAANAQSVQPVPQPLPQVVVPLISQSSTDHGEKEATQTYDATFHPAGAPAPVQLSHQFGVQPLTTTQVPSQTMQNQVYANLQASKDAANNRAPTPAQQISNYQQQYLQQYQLQQVQQPHPSSATQALPPVLLRPRPGIHGNTQVASSPTSGANAATPSATVHLSPIVGGGRPLTPVDLKSQQQAQASQPPIRRPTPVMVQIQGHAQIQQHQHGNQYIAANSQSVQPGPQPLPISQAAQSPTDHGDIQKEATQTYDATFHPAGAPAPVQPPHQFGAQTPTAVQVPAPTMQPQVYANLQAAKDAANNRAPTPAQQLSNYQQHYLQQYQLQQVQQPHPLSATQALPPVLLRPRPGIHGNTQVASSPTSGANAATPPSAMVHPSPIVGGGRPLTPVDLKSQQQAQASQGQQQPIRRPTPQQAVMAQMQGHAHIQQQSPQIQQQQLPQTQGPTQGQQLGAATTSQMQQTPVQPVAQLPNAQQRAQQMAAYAHYGFAPYWRVAQQQQQSQNPTPQMQLAHQQTAQQQHLLAALIHQIAQQALASGQHFSTAQIHALAQQKFLQHQALIQAQAQAQAQGHVGSQHQAQGGQQPQQLQVAHQPQQQPMTPSQAQAMMMGKMQMQLAPQMHNASQGSGGQRPQGQTTMTPAQVQMLYQQAAQAQAAQQKGRVAGKGVLAKKGPIAR